MLKIKNFKALAVYLAVLFFISSCGYLPSSKYSRAVTGDSISTSIIISAEDPENTVLIKDAVNSALVESLHTSLVDKSKSKTHLVLSISKPSYFPIQYDLNGYIVAYRANIRLEILRLTDGASKSYLTQGSYDFSIDPNAILTDQERFESIKFSALKAIKLFLAQISAEGSVKSKTKNR